MPRPELLGNLLDKHAGRPFIFNNNRHNPSSTVPGLRVSFVVVNYAIARKND